MKMYIIYNDYIPFKGFKAMQVFNLLFVRNGMRLTDIDINHETIHANQQMEMFLLGIPLSIVLWSIGCGWWSLVSVPLFFWWYSVEYMLRGFSEKAYRNISFEREAYANEYNMHYMETRRLFAWLKYLFN